MVQDGIHLGAQFAVDGGDKFIDNGIGDLIDFAAGFDQLSQQRFNTPSGHIIAFIRRLQPGGGDNLIQQRPRFRGLPVYTR